MLKIALFTVVYLVFMKSRAKSSVVGNRNDESNQWLQSFNTIASPMSNWFGSDSDAQTEQSPPDHNPNTEEGPFKGTESPQQFSDIVNMLRTEIDKSDNTEKENYQKLLTNLKQLLAQKSRYAKIFFKHMWHYVDLGLYNSNQRVRNASLVENIFEQLQDLLSWIYRQAYDLFTWNLKPKKETTSQNRAHTEEDDKEKHEEQHEEHHEDTPKITDPDDKSVHKIVHKLDLDPFLIKLDMKITCHIYNEGDGPPKDTSKNESEDSKPIAHRSPERDIEKMNRLAELAKQRNQPKHSSDSQKNVDEKELQKKYGDSTPDISAKSADTKESPKKDEDPKSDGERTETAEEAKRRSARRPREPGIITGMTSIFMGKRPNGSTKEK